MAQRLRLESESHGESQQPRRIDIISSNPSSGGAFKLEFGFRHDATIEIQDHVIAHPVRQASANGHGFLLTHSIGGNAVVIQSEPSELIAPADRRLPVICEVVDQFETASARCTGRLAGQSQVV